MNSTVGLCPYSVNLDDGGTYRSSKGQRWLWRNWLSFWDEVRKIARKNEIWTIFNGDMVDVNSKYQTSQQISQNETDVFNMALDTLEPALENSSRVFVVRGTAAHVKSSASMEEKIAIDIDAEKCGDQYSWWELLLECEHVQFDIQHHGTLGQLPHTRANSLNKLIGILLIKYRNKRCPDVALRSHMHQYARSSDEYGISAYSLPAWQLKTEYAHRLSKVEPADIGGMYFICDKGEYTPVVKRYKPEVARAWRPSRQRT